MNEHQEIDPVVAEAVKKADIAWIAVKDQPARAMWCLWTDDALHLVCGPGEQDDPGLNDAGDCRVSLRGDHNGRIVDVTAEVTTIRPGSSRWEDIAGALASKRLNASGSDTVARWAAEAVIYRLEPVPGGADHGDRLPNDSLAAAPPPSPAARPARPPYRLHRLRRR